MSMAFAPPLPEMSSLIGLARNGLTCGSSELPVTDADTWNAADFWPVVAVIALVSIAAGVGAFADAPPPPPPPVAGSSAPHAASATALVINSGTAIRFIITFDHRRRSRDARHPSG